ncbi:MULTISPECIES: LysR substrate-binding domain-containing protein [unclassified Neisseria]|uniref:LysR substrate-binding domain-containing protein n=1 Tax=unclassified Neisseria TaxID=2623750 RepID=UPI0010717AFD|nr:MULTISPECIES: LysR substrate-binding domain-containing protein [unclassified Neisseria]MBF0803411.1 LysR family transcriptional regulator [Neisseria sp. 19428wB4_WF04]TFU43920.1 LysR family transcriptional regulator [Neisseria sp. WF04]
MADSERLFARNSRQQDQHIAGSVRIAVPDMALMQEVLGELWEKLAGFPDLIDWRSDLGLVDVVDAQIDVGIRFGTPEDSRLIIKKVGTAEDYIVASPELIAQTGMPEDWQSLQRHYPLSALINPNTGRVWNWYLSNQYQFSPARPKFVSNRMENELIGVLKGQAFACLPRLLCQPYLSTGELVELFPEMERKKWTAYVYRPQRTVTPPRIRFVFDALAEILAQKLARSKQPARHADQA